METILFITDLHIGAQIAKISGVFSQARRHGWRVVEIERDRTMRPVADFVASLRPIGCIYECSGLGENPSDAPVGIPTVLLDPAPSTGNKPRFAVASDSAAIARMAAAENSGTKTILGREWRMSSGKVLKDHGRTSSPGTPSRTSSKQMVQSNSCARDRYRSIR